MSTSNRYTQVTCSIGDVNELYVYYAYWVQSRRYVINVCFIWEYTCIILCTTQVELMFFAQKTTISNKHTQVTCCICDMEGADTQMWEARKREGEWVRKMLQEAVISLWCTIKKEHTTLTFTVSIFLVQRVRRFLKKVLIIIIHNKRPTDWDYLMD